MSSTINIRDKDTITAEEYNKSLGEQETHKSVITLWTMFSLVVIAIGIAMILGFYFGGIKNDTQIQDNPAIVKGNCQVKNITVGEYDCACVVDCGRYCDYAYAATCWDIDIFFDIENFEETRDIQQMRTCRCNDMSCADKVTHQFAVSTDHTCWYNSENSQVYWEKPYKISGHWVGIIFGGIVICLGLMSVYAERKYSKN